MLLCSNVEKFVQQEVGEIWIEKNFRCLSNCCYSVDYAKAPKPARASPQQFTQSAPNFRWCYSRMYEHRFFAQWSISIVGSSIIGSVSL